MLMPADQMEASRAEPVLTGSLLQQRFKELSWIQRLGMVMLSCGLAAMVWTAGLVDVQVTLSLLVLDNCKGWWLQ